MATKTGISQPQSHLGVVRATAAFGRPGGAYYLFVFLQGPIFDLFLFILIG